MGGMRGGHIERSPGDKEDSKDNPHHIIVVLDLIVLLVKDYLEIEYKGECLLKKCQIENDAILPGLRCKD